MDARGVRAVQKAYVFCAKTHDGQSRLSGEPYLVHPLAVALILAQMRLDPVTVTAGLLHDVLEDTETPAAEIERLFGAEVARVVDGVTKLSKLAYSTKAEAQAESFRKMLIAMADDLRVILVKLADRLHNMRTLKYLPRPRQIAIAKETREIFAPIAHRLGMGRLKDELEDLVFQHLEPERHAALVAEIQQRAPVEEDFIRRTEEALARALEDAGIPATIRARRKHLASIQRKLASRKIGVQEIYDYVAFRIVTEDVAACYAALGVIHARWTPIQARFKDFIATPKPNGYQSLHTTLLSESGQPFEVQIRTKPMHGVAEEGVAAHWTYKEGGTISSHEAERFAWLRNLVDAQREHADPTEFMQAVRMGLYGDEVFCFTPRGDVKVLPAGSTAIDFAYAVHTEVGHHCVGARIDGVLVPLRTQLQHGNRVEIITSPNQRPSRDWLQYAATFRARTRIRQWFNARERDATVATGRSVLEKEARRRGTTAKRLLESREGQQAFRQMGFRDAEDFLAAVAQERAKPAAFFERAGVEVVTRAPRAAPPVEASAPPSSVTARAGRRRAAGPGPVIAAGVTDLMVVLARCCGPVRGEPIRGYVTRGRGVSVHRADCRGLASLAADQSRLIEVAWAPGGEHVTDVRLRLDVMDRPGMLGDVSTVVSSVDTNIKEARARALAGGRGVIWLTVAVEDAVHLERVRRALGTIEGVRRVDR